MNTVDHPRPRFIRSALACLLFSACASAALAEDFVYVVQAGDNPWNLTRRYLKSIDYWPRIQDYNRILEPQGIRPGTVLRIPIAWMRGERRTAHVIDARGEAEIRIGEQRTAATPGMPVPPGAHIRSGAGSSLTLEFPDGSRSLIGADTELGLRKLERLKASGAQQLDIDLQRGHIENLARPVQGGGRYIIRTPAAVAAVRGTDFRISAERNGVRAETLHGEVALQNRHGLTRLPAGKGSQAVRGRAPEKASPLLPAPALDTLPAVVDRVPFRLPIAPVAGAAAYRTQIAANTGFTALDSDRSDTDAAALGGILADGPYRLRIRAIDGRGLEGHDAERDIVVDARPEPPFPNEPARDGFATGERVRFVWAHNPEATAYHFQLATDPGFGQVLVHHDNLQIASLTLDDELPTGDYYWRVALSTAAEGRGPYSDAQRFRRPPPGPAAEPPAIDADTLQLHWRAVDGVETYRVELASTPDFATPEHAFDTRTPQLVMDRPEGGTWHVRIRGQEAGSPPGPWSKPQQIEVPRSHWRALLILLPVLLAL